jgi:hypothetical protein
MLEEQVDDGGEGSANFTEVLTVLVLLVQEYKY